MPRIATFAAPRTRRHAPPARLSDPHKGKGKEALANASDPENQAHLQVQRCSTRPSYALRASAALLTGGPGKTGWNTGGGHGPAWSPALIGAGDHWALKRRRGRRGL